MRIATISQRKATLLHYALLGLATRQGVEFQDNPDYPGELIDVEVDNSKDAAVVQQAIVRL